MQPFHNVIEKLLNHRPPCHRLTVRLCGSVLTHQCADSRSSYMNWRPGMRGMGQLARNCGVCMCRWCVGPATVLDLVHQNEKRKQAGCLFERTQTPRVENASQSVLFLSRICHFSLAVLRKRYRWLDTDCKVPSVGSDVVNGLFVSWMCLVPVLGPL